MEYQVPRVVLAGTNSGCGKTTVSCAILQALVNRKVNVGAFKCGPDYIDPMFHSEIIGAKSVNLDPFFFDQNTINYLLASNGEQREVNIVEGVMGFYDGIDMVTAKGSTYEVAKLTNSPVVLVLGVRGASLSVMATIYGFLNMMPNNNVCGVILNQCTAMTYKVLAEEIERRFEGKIKPLGYLPVMKDCSLESRHLGLVTAAEVVDLKDKLQKVAAQAEQSIDLDGLIELAKAAEKIKCDKPQFETFSESVRIAVAKDTAFCFYYEDSLRMLREMGAELVEFSPLTDEALPENIQGLYLGGGYPELYTETLSNNKTMLASIKQALENNLPCIAECGGFMYLTESIADKPMVGFIKGGCKDTGKLVRFGYVHLKANKDNMLCKAGEEIPAHEFHHWDADNPGTDFNGRKETGRNWDCAIANEKLYAGYPHFHFFGNPKFAENFYKTCLEEKHND
ncbi:MAG: cobyrinate a,c-diamide synthase [Clostridia bacterium]|nr:cobyrinate a,c-diamide synthase [Clostridia bacterium]